MAIPDSYLALLDILADAFEHYEIATGDYPVLVGGGAAAMQTQGAFMSGDLDLYAPSDAALAAALLHSGFVKEERRGRLAGGSITPNSLNMASRQSPGNYSMGAPTNPD